MAGSITRRLLFEHHFRETVIFAQSDAADTALRSHAGPGANEVLLSAPTAMEFKVEPHLFRTRARASPSPLDDD